MHPKYLRTYTVSKLRNVIVWFVVSVTLICGVIIFSTVTKQKNEQALTELRTKESLNATLKAKLNIANTALVAWQDVIKKEHGERTGLKIKVAQKVIDQLKHTYKINKFVVGLSNPTKRSDIQSKFVEVFYSTVTLDFDAYSDIDAYLFINSLVQQMPGHVMIRSIDMTGIDSVDKAVLLNLSGGSEVGIVSAKVELVWQDMNDMVKLNEAVNQKKPAKK